MVFNVAPPHYLAGVGFGGRGMRAVLAKKSSCVAWDVVVLGALERRERWTVLPVFRSSPIFALTEFLQLSTCSCLNELLMQTDAGCANISNACIGKTAKEAEMHLKLGAGHC